MPQEIRTVTLRGRLFSVNCYLVRGDDGWVLIDSGTSGGRSTVERALADAGCGTGELRLIVITHADSDHTGNAAHLRRTHRAPIAMHRAEWPAAERGNMLLNRGRMPLLRRLVAGPMFRLTGLHGSDRFTPDLPLEDGEHLSAFGLDATVVHLPGHSQGSVGILTADGDLFCGDQFTNTDRPEPNTLVDDRAALEASLARLRTMEVATVHPGHGQPFRMEELAESGA